MVFSTMIQSEISKRKSVENLCKKLQEDNEKLVKLKNTCLENNKALQKKIVQNESVKEFFETQLKEHKDLIAQL